MNMFPFFKREPEPDMIRLDTHKEIVAEIEKDAQAEREAAARILQRNIELRGRVDDLVAELATLRPDAEKHRERVRKATMNLKQNRAKAGVASHG